MKVFLTIWILAVLIQEVVPSTLVRLPRNAAKNLSLVHTEYEAKYEQKGKHGNESYSKVSGKQEIVHDNCAENWNTFAEKCASLIKDLVASLANAVSSKPGDATNLQLHIKNTFKHFDNTHNCTCLNHSKSNLSDLDLSPLFNNITIKTARPGVKNREKSSSENKINKCGGNGEPCDGQQNSGSNGIISSGSNNPGSEQKQVKKCGQYGNEPCSGHGGKPPEHHLSPEHQKQLNRELAHAKDLDMNPENAEGSSDDQSTNNSRRQVKYPPNLEKPRKISADSNPTQPKNVRYPFLVTARPIPQSAKPSESPYLSQQSLDPDSLDSQNSEPRSGLVSQENSSTNVPAGSSTTKRNGAQTGIENSAPLQSSQKPNHQQNAHSGVVSDDPIIDRYKSAPGKSIYNNQRGQPTVVLPEEAVSDKQTPNPVYMPGKFQNHQHPMPTMSKSSKSTNYVPNTQSPEPVPHEQPIDRFSSNPARAASLQSDSRRQPTVMHPEHPSADSQALSPEFKPEQKDDQNSAPFVVTPERSTNNKPNGQPMIVLPEKSVADKPKAGKEEPQPIVILPEESKTKESAADSLAMDPAAEDISGKDPKNENSASPVFVRNGKPVVESPPEQASLPIENDSPQAQENPTSTMTKDSTEHKHPPNSHFNSNPPESLEPENKDEIEITNPSLDESTSSPSELAPHEDPENTSPEDTFVKSTDDQTTLEQDTTTYAPTTTAYTEVEYDLDHTVSVIHPTPDEPEIANQQSGDSISTEEYIQVTPIPDQSHLRAHELPQETQDTEGTNLEEGHQRDSKHPIKEHTFSTPAPVYQGNIVTVTPDNHSKPGMAVEDDGSEGKEAVEGESTIESNNPEDQKQADMENVTEEMQNEHSNSPVHPEMKGTTPVAFYTVQPVSTEAQSTMEPAQMNDNSEFKNNENQESFEHEDFITPAPTSTVKPTEFEPEQQNESMGNPTQSVATNGKSVSTHPTNMQEEYFITHSPTKSDDEEYTRVTAQSDYVTEKPTKSNSDHHSEGNDYSSTPPSTTSSETKAISPEPQPETAVPPPVLKPSQPGVLVSTTETQPHEGEGQDPLIHPTTFQTTSEEPTSAQGVHSGSASLSRPTTTVPQDSDETIPVQPSTSPKTTRTHQHDDDDDDDEDCCSCESCTEEELTDPKQYRENACKNLEEARRELKAIFDKIKKKLKCGRKAPQTITAS